MSSKSKKSKFSAIRAGLVDFGIAERAFCRCQGVKQFRHPVVGELTLSYETMELTADAGLTLAVFTAERGSKSEEALNLLASWAAPADEAPLVETADRT